MTTEQIAIVEEKILQLDKKSRQEINQTLEKIIKNQELEDNFKKEIENVLLLGVQT